MKLPGPDHPITITRNPKRVRVSAGGMVIADTLSQLKPGMQLPPRID